jgi:hypothetical protein
MGTEFRCDLAGELLELHEDGAQWRFAARSQNKLARGKLLLVSRRQHEEARAQLDACTFLVARCPDSGRPPRRSSEPTVAVSVNPAHGLGSYSGVSESEFRKKKQRRLALA